MFAELLRSFGARSETCPVWRMNLLSNLIVIVVVISFGIQVGSHHNTMLAGFLKTSLMPFSDCLMLQSISVIPLLALEGVKGLRRRSTRTFSAIKGHGVQSAEILA